MRSVRRQIRLKVAETVKIGQMSPFVHQLTTVVLPMDIHQHGSQFLQLDSADRDSANAAGAFPVREDAALNDKLIIRFNLVVTQIASGLFGHVKACRHNGAFRTASYQLAADTISENSANRINHDGFSGACLARQNIQPRCEADVRALDHSNIFNVKFV